MVTGRPSIASKMPSKSERWSFSSSSSAASSSTAAVGEDQALHDRQAVAEEHVLGAAEADALGAELARHLRVVGQVGVGAHLQRAGTRRPSRGSCSKGPLGSGVTTGDLADHDLAGRAVDRDDLALAHGHAVDLDELPRDDVDLRARFGTAHRGRAHAARDDRGVAHEPAARREDALGRDHAVEVVGRRLGPHEDHVLRPARGAARRRRR